MKVIVAGAAAAVAVALTAASASGAGAVDVRLTGERVGPRPVAGVPARVVFTVRYVGRGDEWRGGFRYVLTIWLPPALAPVSYPAGACSRRRQTLTCRGSIPRADTKGVFPLRLRPGPPGRYLVRGWLKPVDLVDVNPGDNIFELPLPVARVAASP